MSKPISKGVQEETDGKSLERAARAIEIIAECKPHLLPAVNKLADGYGRAVQARKDAEAAAKDAIAQAMADAGVKEEPGAPEEGDDTDV